MEMTKQQYWQQGSSFLALLAGIPKLPRKREIQIVNAAEATWLKYGDLVYHPGVGGRV